MSLCRFVGCDDHENYFTNTQRHRVVSDRNSSTCIQGNYSFMELDCVLFQVYEILARTVYGKRRRAEVGVDRLINEGVYKAAFPLHEVRSYLLALKSDTKLLFFEPIHLFVSSGPISASKVRSSF